MSKWKYKSLDWIHKVREKNYDRTKNKSLDEIIEEGKVGARKIIVKLAREYAAPMVKERREKYKARKS